MANITGTVTFTETTYGTIKRIKAVFSSGEGTGAGAATGSTVKSYAGKLLWVVTDPGSAAPSVDWDLTITDSDSLDLLVGGGADRHTSNTEYIKEADLGSVATGKLTVNVTNAGDQKTGTIYVFIR